jgi:hypothetical protein
VQDSVTAAGEQRVNRCSMLNESLSVNVPLRIPASPLAQLRSAVHVKVYRTTVLKHAT